ncbi:MAG TPA: hypothetical protein VFV05_11595 [Methylomirabilota bacterium]|nr:hypothetical protein [Methylomirabilota bacterium]
MRRRGVHGAVADLFRRAPIFVDKILEGARPADLPMEQPTRVELIPQTLLARADEVLQ